MQADWLIFKNFAVDRKLSIQYVDLGDSYLLGATSRPFDLSCVLAKDTDDCTDFETNFKPTGNQLNPNEVVTQYEKNDKDLKLAKGVAEVGEDGKATVYIQVPGTFGSAEGRYVTGGYGISEDYNPDDYCKVDIEDKDRILAMMIARMMNPEATEPVSDATVQGMGEIPGVGAFPAYPTVKSYTDDEQPEEHQGWYFWPLAQGGSLPPVGEVEVNPIGGYGFLPAGFYIKIIYCRPAGVTTGKVRINVDWGKKP